MEDDAFRYDLWLKEALRQVIMRALSTTAVEGLPGDHHFYITFRTNVPGVNIPPSLRAQHPDEMTIVLQHQFEELAVDEEGFSVVLRFNGNPQKLRVPFEMVTYFADPSADFGLNVGTVELLNRGHVNFDDEDFDQLNVGPVNTSEESVKNTSKPGEVITLDAFRKK